MTEIESLQKGLDIQCGTMNKLQKSTEQHDYILLDCSSSMIDKWWESLSSIDAYVNSITREGVRSRVTFHMFYEQNPDYIHCECSNTEWQPIVHGAPVPMGSTPLYDAVNLMGRRLRDSNPERCSIVIVTDGDNNASQTTLVQAQAILNWCRAKGWQVTFIGADFSNYRMASLLGANKGTAIGVQKRLLSSAASALAKKRAAYGLNGTPMHYSEEEQQQFGGYLAPPRS